MNNLLKIFLIILIIIIILCSLCTLKYKNEGFRNNLNYYYSCYDVVENKAYTIDELIYFSGCPNLVIYERIVGGFPYYYVGNGNRSGPYFAGDYTDYWYLGFSQKRGYLIDTLNRYDLYEYSRLNPYRWFWGKRYGYDLRRNRLRNWGPGWRRWKRNRRNRRNRRKKLDKD